MEVSMEIGEVRSVGYSGEGPTGNHIFICNGNYIFIPDDSLNGKSLLKLNSNFYLKRNTVSQYTIVGEATYGSYTAT